MELFIQLAAALARAFPSIANVVLIVMVAYIASTISRFASNHMLHVQGSLDRIEEVMRAMNEGIIRLLGRTDHRK